MYPLILGIDPGQSGAFAFMLNGRPGAVELLKDVSPAWIKANMIEGNTFACLERAQAMPNQGSVSMMTYGTGYGRVIGWLEALSIPFALVPPKIWQKQLHTGCKSDDPKVRTLQAVEHLFPGLNLRATERSKKPHLGIVDAVAIAHYGVLTYGRNK